MKKIVIVLLMFSSQCWAETIWPVVTWEEPFNYESPVHAVQYRPTSIATQPWHLCISYPHLKDSYWLNVNYGMVEEANRLGVGFQILDAGGYPELARQREQIEECVAQGADALIIGAVSFDGLTDLVLKISKKIPVLATVNDIADEGISAKAGVSWTEMGFKVGQYLAQKHPKGSKEAKVAWLPGPDGSGWVIFNTNGFMKGISGSAIRIAVTKWGDTGKEIQRTLVQEILESHPDIDYIVGNALMAEAAISILREKDLNNRIKVISTYLTPGVHRGLRRGRILVAPTDSPVLQGRLSIDQTVRILEKRSFEQHVGPEVNLLDQRNVSEIDLEHEFAPASFQATFQIK